MSDPGIRTFYLEGGRKAHVPSAAVQQWMQRMDQRGLKFSTDASAFGEAPAALAPEAPPSDADLAEQFTALPSVSQTDMWTQRAAADPAARLSSWLRETGSDAMRGLNQGLYSQGSDEAAAGIRAATGGNFDAALGEERSANAAARQRSPYAFAAAEMAGAIPGALVGGLRSVVPAGMLAGALGSDSGDAEETARDAVQGGTLAAATGPAAKLAGRAVDAVAPAVQRGADAGAGVMHRGSNRALNAAIGGTPGDFQRLAERYGLDYAEGGSESLGESARRLGLVNRVVPQDASDFARRAATARDAAGAAKGVGMDEAMEQLPPGMITRDRLVREMQGRVQGTPASEGQAAIQRKVRDDLVPIVESRLPPKPTIREIDAQKQAFYDDAYNAGKVADSPSSLRAQGAQLGGDVMRKGVLDSLDYALPETRDKIVSANRDFGDASAIEQMARDRAAGRQGASGWDYGLTALGLGGGAMTGDPMNMVGGAIAGMTAAPAVRAARQYAPSVAANALELGSQGARGLGTMATPVAAPQGALAATGAIAAQQGTGGPSELDLMDEFTAGDRGMSSSRGYLMPAAVKQAFQSRPDMLGPYAARFQQAMQAEDPETAVNALLERLEMTDDQWRTQYLPRLRGMTASR